MKYSDIPYINILEKECATKEEIKQFLNIGSSIFERMNMHKVRNGRKGVSAL